jgi:hypothetical protein
MRPQLLLLDNIGRLKVAGSGIAPQPKGRTSARFRERSSMITAMIA